MPCSARTTRTRLLNAGLPSRVPAKKPFLSPEHKAERLRFAQTYAAENVDFWRSVIFTDECSFSSVSTAGRHCRRRTGERYNANNIYSLDRSGRVSQAMHGWMWYGGVGELATIEGNMNSYEYINILETSFLPSVRTYAIMEPDPIYFVQDRSPIHNSGIVRDWFSRHPEIHLLDWPPKGCDINPIENIWGIMKREWEVGEQTKAAVIRHSYDVWEGIRGTPDMCSKLVDSLPSRLQQVIDADGGWIKY